MSCKICQISMIQLLMGWCFSSYWEGRSKEPRELKRTGRWKIWLGAGRTVDGGQYNNRRILSPFQELEADGLYVWVLFQLHVMMMTRMTLKMMSRSKLMTTMAMMMAMMMMMMIMLCRW